MVDGYGWVLLAFTPLEICNLAPRACIEPRLTKIIKRTPNIMLQDNLGDMAIDLSYNRKGLFPAYIIFYSFVT